MRIGQMTLLMTSLLLVSCKLTSTENIQDDTEANQRPLPKGFFACPEPRPEICTQIYLPVETIDRQGKRGRYGNSCSACSRPNIIGYRPLAEADI